MLIGNEVTLCVLVVVWISRWLFAIRDTRLNTSILVSFLIERSFHTLLKHGWEEILLAGIRVLPLSSCLIIIFLSFYGFLCFGTRKQPHIGSNSPQPLIFPSRTTHTRFFPKHHAFSYSYLLVAIPVGWKGKAGSLILVDCSHENDITERPNDQDYDVRGWTWMSIRASDYLERGNAHLDLRGKLAVYLDSQGEDLGNYTSAWLVTAPRFLGYAFNPVSFWYLYQQDHLAAMVLEVNNTFDERRMYFMKNDPNGPVNAPFVDLPRDKSKKHRFVNHWVKDFHVSPFNSRKGSYSLSAREPNFGGDADIDNSITLSSSKEHVKIVARIHSTSASMQAGRMTLFQEASFVISWFWIGFLTFPRILKEASKLFFRKKLHVWYRPEVLRGSIGRHATHREVIIESVFQVYLQNVLASSSSTRFLKYIHPALGASQEKIIHSSISAAKGKESRPIELTVLTPQFFTDIALCSDPSDYMRKVVEKPQQEQTFNCSDVEDFCILFKQQKAVASTPSKTEPLTWRLCRILRQSAERHPLDEFARNNLSNHQAEAYRGATTSLLFSQYTCFGIVEIIDFVITLLRTWLGYILIRRTTGLLDNQKHGGYTDVIPVIVHVSLLAASWICY